MDLNDFLSWIEDSINQSNEASKLMLRSFYDHDGDIVGLTSLRHRIIGSTPHIEKISRGSAFTQVLGSYDNAVQDDDFDEKTWVMVTLAAAKSHVFVGANRDTMPDPLNEMSQLAVDEAWKEIHLCLGVVAKTYTLGMNPLD